MILIQSRPKTSDMFEVKHAEIQVLIKFIKYKFNQLELIYFRPLNQNSIFINSFIQKRYLQNF